MRFDGEPRIDRRGGAGPGVPRRRAVALAGALAVALTACSPIAEIPDSAQVTCRSGADCPAGFLCHAGLCGRPASIDSTAPDLLSDRCQDGTSAIACVAPALGRAGTTFTIDLTATEPLAAPPAVTLQLAPEVEVPCAVAGANAYRCTYTATGTENGGLGGLVAFDVRLRDLAQNATVRNHVGILDLDLTAPQVLTAGVAYFPAPSNLLPTVQRATAGTRVHVAVSADEVLATPPTLTVDLGGGPVAFDPVAGATTPFGGSFELLVPPGTPDGSYTPRIAWVDLAGNGATVSLTGHPVVVKTSTPTLVVNQAKVVALRSPWGDGAPEFLAGHTIPAGAYFALERADPLSGGATLDPDTFTLAGGATPGAVSVRAGPRRDATVLGTLRPDANGGWPRQALSAFDQSTVYVVGVDDAGNPSLPVKILAGEWVATPNPPKGGTSPHLVEWVGAVSSTEQQESATPDSLGAAAARDDQVILATAARAFSPRFIATTAPSAAVQAAMAYDSGRGRVVLFGGSAASGGTPSQETWEWDGAWWRQVATTGPSARTGAAMVYDAARGRVVLHGGIDASYHSQDDTWEWDGASWSRVAATGPGARYAHAMAYDAGRRRVVLFGGNGVTLDQADTWEWDGRRWSFRAMSGPAGRRFHAMAYDAASGKVMLFGGRSGITPLGDTWAWNGNGWTQVASTGPAAREAAALACDTSRGRLVLFGGYATASSPFQDTWEWTWNGTGTAGAWARVATGGPSPRYEHALVHDAARGGVLLFGGTGATGALPDTWSWDGTAWTRIAILGPRRRGGHAMARDLARGPVVLFGGTDGTLLGDTWSWNGDGWALASTGGPSARSGHAMAYDAGSGGVILFGGTDASGLRGDTWGWDGATWTSLAVTGPSPRTDHAMAFDAARGRTVLFGGTDASGRRGDTWEWNGTSWSPVASTGPGARAEHAMAYDGAGARTVLFGGWDGTTALGDTWAFDGGAWTQLSSGGTSGTTPSPRRQSALAYDPAARRVVLVGGLASSPLYDSWELDGSAWQPVRVTGWWSVLARYAHAMALDTRGRLVVFGGKSSATAFLAETWVSATSGPAVQVELLRCPVDAAWVQALRIRAYTGATSAAGQGAVLLGFAAPGAAGEPGAWVPLASNTTPAALQAPFLPAAPASLLDWQAATPAGAQRFLQERDGRLAFQVRPSGASGTPRAALDYLEARLRYAIPADVPPTGLHYASDPAVYQVGQRITPNLPASTGDAALVYSIAPALPPGLGLDADTGAILGTPTAVTPQRSYTVTGTNAGGSGTGTVALRVLGDATVPPTQLVYATNPASYPAGLLIPPNAPLNEGGVITSYTVDPPLPTGLAIDPATGIISGTPGAVSPAAPYTITGSNQGGQATATVSVTVTGCSPARTFCNGDPSLVCFPDGTCGACQLDTDCPAGLLCAFGQCLGF